MFDQLAINITSVIDCNKSLRRVGHINKDDYMGHIGFLTAVATVKVSQGRITGKSTYIINNAGEKDLVVIASERLKSIFLSCKAQVICENDVWNNVPIINEKVYENIYFDDSSYIDRKAIEDVYVKTANENVFQTYIHLG